MGQVLKILGIFFKSNLIQQVLNAVLAKLLSLCDI